jgi:hypothetical protein
MEAQKIRVQGSVLSQVEFFAFAARSSQPLAGRGCKIRYSTSILPDQPRDCPSKNIGDVEFKLYSPTLCRSSLFGVHAGDSGKSVSAQQIPPHLLVAPSRNPLRTWYHAIFSFVERSRPLMQYVGT